MQTTILLPNILVIFKLEKKCTKNVAMFLVVEIREEYGDNEAMQLTCYAIERLIEFDLT